MQVQKQSCLTNSQEYHLVAETIEEIIIKEKYIPNNNFIFKSEKEAINSWIFILIEQGILKTS